jgi:hypothetical protein
MLLRALLHGYEPAVIQQNWEAVRDALARTETPEGKALRTTLTNALDEIRRAWIAAAPDDWLALNAPYCPLDDVRRLLAQPEHVALVTTKEGEFARGVLGHWGVHLTDIQGKEAGTHKCDNLRALIARYETTHGRRPALWFVEDRLETLQHVTTHPDLDDVALFLTTWGYNTPEARASVQEDGRIRLLDLEQFRDGLASWR